MGQKCAFSEASLFEKLKSMQLWVVRGIRVFGASKWLYYHEGSL